MRTLCWCSLLTLLSALVYPAGAAIRPRFSLDFSSFHATNIVMVVTVSDDATFEVVESWKGDVGIGERLVIPELRPLANAIPISHYPKSWTEGSSSSEMIPKQPLGSRMILFLRSSTAQESTPNNLQKTGRREWLPSDLMHSMKASVVWINRNQLYCFSQPSESSVLVSLPFSMEQVRNRVLEIIRIQESMAVALAAQDDHKRAEGLKPYVRSEILPVQHFALQQLGMSGPSAVPTIRGMLDDATFADEASELIEALVKAGGKGVGEDLNGRLLQELAFWRSAAPSLPQGWWNADPSIHAPLREKYNATYQLVVGIEQIHYSPALGSVRQLRNFWRSLPQLNDPAGLNQMVEECDKSIRHLQTN